MSWVPYLNKLEDRITKLEKALRHISENTGHKELCKKSEHCMYGCDAARVAIKALKKL